MPESKIVMSKDAFMDEDEAGPFVECRDADRWRKLAVAVRDRRSDLGLNQEEARYSAGVGNQFWSHLENAKLGPRIYLNKVKGIEKALRWKKNSVQWVLLNGGEPVPSEESPTMDFIGDEVQELREVVADLQTRLDAVERTADDLRPLLKMVRDLRA
jgi:hypothetical protein